MGRDFRINVNHHSAPSSPTASTHRPPTPTDLSSPFSEIEGLDRDELREAAYEVFFTACRSSPGFGGRSALTYYNSSSIDTADPYGACPGSPGKHNGVGMAVTSRVKRALGLKMMKKTPSTRRTNSCGAVPMPTSPNSMAPGPSSPRFGFTVPNASRSCRPLTSAEIMRQQMKVTEQSDNRLRKTLMRTLVGQMGRRAETIILPLELLRHLKPSEFSDAVEYHMWQQRQLKILEAGLVLHPSIPLDKMDAFATRFKEILDSSDQKAIDTGKNSATMRALCNCVVSLAWRSPNGGSTDVCHWADGYPLNVHIYTALLASIFDSKEETMVLDQVDELLELMKKTWSTLGINRSIHNLCFTWVLFEQFVATGQVEPDLLAASFAMLTEVASDAKKSDRDPYYLKMLARGLNSMKTWTEARLLNYHHNFNRETVGLMENMLPLLFSVTKILEEDVPAYVASSQEKDENGDESSGNRVDYYIRSSLKNAFDKVVEDKDASGLIRDGEVQEASELLMKLARKTEELAMKEKDIFSPLLKRWHPIATGVAAVTLHSCYGGLLKQFLAGKSPMLNEIAIVLQRAGKLEKSLVQLVVEDSVECEDGGKAIVREMVPYEVETIMHKQLKQWSQDRLSKGKENILRAKQTETWNPKSQHEPHAYSAVEVISFAKEAIENFFDIPIPIIESSFHYLIDGVQNIFREYIAFVASCGTKQNYMPTLPPLTRCSRDSKFVKLWKRAACSVGVEDLSQILSGGGGNHLRPTTSRGTQRLYIRLNTLHYLVAQLQTLDKSVSMSPKVLSNKSLSSKKKSPSHFKTSLSTLQLACRHVSEVAAYRLIFLDSNSVLYGSLYIGGVGNTRINPALRVLKQNLTLLCAIVTERAQPRALKEVMKACFESFLMVLLAGGNNRMFCRLDHPAIEEDFDLLKSLFCTIGEGMIVEDVVERESEVVQGVVALMGHPTEQLVEDISSVATETCGLGGVGQKIPMPPTTGKWNRSDPNTILRVLCARKDRAATHFLKKTFHLAKRGSGIRII
ncbi:protein unc-13 homolog isoform X1 [Salvia hispanica]|uniref:protein unc-13 homolog isoform X1 n=2 Tax=Salvia hispanica TaxID=49212 RepID=UPI0020095C88|nr:protein unc-13 homolog isoform X1 [Salvia hispanica]